MEKCVFPSYQLLNTSFPFEGGKQKKKLKSVNFDQFDKKGRGSSKKDIDRNKNTKCPINAHYHLIPGGITKDFKKSKEFLKNLH